MAKFEVIKIENGGLLRTGEAGQIPPQAPHPQRKEILLGVFEGKVSGEPWIGELMESAARAAGITGISRIIVERLGSRDKEYADYSLIIADSSRIIGKIKEAD